jgi:uncharacterized membrane protein YkvA (DUF1232 family)
MSFNSGNRPAGGWNIPALLKDAVAAWRLLWDPHVPSALKLVLPVAAFLYLLSPLDLLPGPFDDIAVLYVALRFFLQAAPAAAVQRARQAQNPTANDDDNTIDTTWRVVDDPKKK